MYTLNSHSRGAHSRSDSRYSLRPPPEEDSRYTTPWQASGRTAVVPSIAMDGSPSQHEHCRGPGGSPCRPVNNEHERGPADPCLGQQTRVLPPYLNAQAASYTLQQGRAGPESSTNFRLTQRDITLPTAASILALQKAAISNNCCQRRLTSC